VCTPSVDRAKDLKSHLTGPPNQTTVWKTYRKITDYSVGLTEAAY